MACQTTQADYQGDEPVRRRSYDTIRYDTIRYSHCYSPCMASPVRKPTGEAQGSADQSMKKPILVSLILFNYPLKALMLWKHLPRYDTRWYFNVRSKVDTSQLNLRLSNNKKVRKKLKSKNGRAQKYRRTDRGIRGVSREDGHHLSTNRARRRTTSLIRPTTLALRDATPLPLATEWHCILVKYILRLSFNHEQCTFKKCATQIGFQKITRRYAISHAFLYAASTAVDSSKKVKVAHTRLPSVGFRS